MEVAMSYMLKEERIEEFDMSKHLDKLRAQVVINAKNLF
jgi:hypothetical protein